MREKIIVSTNKRYADSSVNNFDRLDNIIASIEGKRVRANKLRVCDIRYAIRQTIKMMRNHGNNAPYEGLTIEVSGCEDKYAKAYKKYSSTAQTTVGTCEYHGGRWYLTKVERVTDYVDRLPISFRVIN